MQTSYFLTKGAIMKNVKAEPVLVEFDLDFEILFIVKYLIRSNSYNFGFIIPLLKKLKAANVGDRVSIEVEGEVYVAEKTHNDKAVILTEFCIFQAKMNIAEKVKNLITTIFKLSIDKKYKEPNKIVSLLHKVLDIYIPSNLTARDISTVRK